MEIDKLLRDEDILSKAGFTPEEIKQDKEAASPLGDILKVDNEMLSAAGFTPEEIEQDKLEHASKGEGKVATELPKEQLGVKEKMVSAPEPTIIKDQPEDILNLNFLNMHSAGFSNEEIQDYAEEQKAKIMALGLDEGEADEQLSGFTPVTVEEAEEIY